jgi:aspartate carbamoyltransferase catalytic subunit
MGADGVVIRHPASGAAKVLADGEWVTGSVINAGDGTHEHPTQALLDAFTIREKLCSGKGDLNGIEIAIIGDVLHSRVARSNILLLKKLGANVTLIAPPTLLPVGVSNWGVNSSYDLDSNIEKYDVVMMLRVQRERMNDSFFPSEREYSREFGLNAERVGNLKRSALIMHPGPMNRGLEISADAADNGKAVIVDQVKNGVIVRMAVLYLLLGGAND